MRGDRPAQDLVFYWRQVFTPHARGSTLYPRFVRRQYPVYPACAGIDPFRSLKKFSKLGLPRMRGDRPFMSVPQTPALVFTPHARGSTHIPFVAKHIAQVYPACAGIDRICPIPRWAARGLPRMRGDRPNKNCKKRLQPQFTPHARGSTAKRR